MLLISNGIPQEEREKFINSVKSVVPYGSHGTKFQEFGFNGGMYPDFEIEEYFPNSYAYYSGGFVIIVPSYVYIASQREIRDQWGDTGRRFCEQVSSRLLAYYIDKSNAKDGTKLEDIFAKGASPETFPVVISMSNHNGNLYSDKIVDVPEWSQMGDLIDTQFTCLDNESRFKVRVPRINTLMEGTLSHRYIGYVHEPWMIQVGETKKTMTLFDSVLSFGTDKIDSILSDREFLELFIMPYMFAPAKELQEIYWKSRIIDEDKFFDKIYEVALAAQKKQIVEAAKRRDKLAHDLSFYKREIASLEISSVAAEEKLKELEKAPAPEKEKTIEAVKRNVSHIESLKYTDRVYPTNTGMLLYTTEIPLIDTIPLGPFRIMINGGNISTPNVNVVNLVNSSGSFDHPHINQGLPCFGNFDSVIQMLSDGEFGIAVDLLYQFLETFNPNDEYGMNVFGFANDEEELKAVYKFYLEKKAGRRIRTLGREDEFRRLFGKSVADAMTEEDKLSDDYCPNCDLHEDECQCYYCESCGNYFNDDYFCHECNRCDNCCTCTYCASCDIRINTRSDEYCDVCHVCSGCRNCRTCTECDTHVDQRDIPTHWCETCNTCIDCCTCPDEEEEVTEPEEVTESSRSPWVYTQTVRYNTSPTSTTSNDYRPF